MHELSYSPDLVSVVIVAHNNWPDLELAIQSALHQSYSPIETIVVDNGSSDETPSQVPKIFGSKVLYHRRESGWDGAGYNAGAKLGRGEFIQFLDGDDLLAPTKIEKQVALFHTDSSADIVYGDVRQFQSQSGVAAWQDWDTRDFDDMLATLLDPNGNGAGLLPDCALFRRTTLRKVGPWDESIYSCDQEFWLRAAASGCRFRHCPRSLVFYRIRPEQQSSRTWIMTRRMATTWTKALAYVRTDPHRRMLVRRLSRLQFFLAVADPDLDRTAAVERLTLAHELDPTTVSQMAVALGRMFVRIPNHSALFQVGRMHYLRHALGKLIGVL